jgi:N-methylhydantoinase A
MRLGEFDHAVASGLLEEMSREVRGWVEPAAHDAELFERRVAYMRYIGQGHEIAVELPLRELGPHDDAVLREQYERSYETLFKRVIPNAAVEIMAWSVTVSTATVLPEPVAVPAASAAPWAAGTVAVFDGRSGQTIRVPRYRREQLVPGARFPGPAIVAEAETSTFITAAFDVWIDGIGSIVMDRKEPQA